MSSRTIEQHISADHGPALCAWIYYPLYKGSQCACQPARCQCKKNRRGLHFDGRVKYRGGKTPNNTLWSTFQRVDLDLLSIHSNMKCHSRLQVSRVAQVATLTRQMSSHMAFGPAALVSRDRVYLGLARYDREAIWTLVP